MSTIADEPRFGGDLQNPNYYRLCYQLLVQYVNGARQNARGSDVSDVDRFSEEDLARGHGWARMLRRQTCEVLKQLEQRSPTPGWFDERRLSPPEQRLQRFLAGTVQPCTLLLTASWLVIEGQKSDAREHLGALETEQPWHRHTAPRRGFKIQEARCRRRTDPVVLPRLLQSRLLCRDGI